MDMVEVADSDGGSTAPSNAVADKFGATALHLLCMDETISMDMLRELLIMSSDDCFNQDVYGRSPLHYICMNQAVSSEMLWLFFDRGNEPVRQTDKDGRTPLHYLCGNAFITPQVLEILFDAWPSAALVADLEFKLPVQYLVENASSSPEVTALLVCGPTSYRHRYEFLNWSSHYAHFFQDGELIHVNTNVAMDSNTATRVLIIFYSSPLILDHEHKMLLHLKTAVRMSEIRGDHLECIPTVHEIFGGAKRRVALRNMDVAPEDQNGSGVDVSRDGSVILDHALVMEAPIYTLEDMRMEKLWDTEVVRSVTTEVANCLHFWHCDARAVHGNITLQNIGQFDNRGLCLYNVRASREFHRQRPVGSRSITLSSCPPEAAKAFVSKEEFLPTPASDIWQFGCVVYNLLTGNTILERLAPWIHSVGHEQVLHLICSITDGALEPIIAETNPKFQLLLRRTLVVNPNYRWGIDRLMQTSDESSQVSFATSETSSEDFIGNSLQQKADEVLTGGNRPAKHAQAQLEFMKNEQSTLRHSLLLTKAQLQTSEQLRSDLQVQVENLQAQMAYESQLKSEAQLESQLLARNHQAMTLQLHTMVEMVVNLVPLARKVHGSAADDFLSRTLSQVTGDNSPSYFPAPFTTTQQKNGITQLVKKQLQQSVLAQGCVQKWASGSQSSAVAAAELASYDGNNKNADEIPGSNDKTGKNSVSSAASMA